MRKAIDILKRTMEGDSELQILVEQERLNAKVAQVIYDARTAAGLTQKELARLIGTRQPVIARLENADYGGHSLKMLFRVASVLGKELDIRFRTPRRPTRSRTVKA